MARQTSRVQGSRVRASRAKAAGGLDDVEALARTHAAGAMAELARLSASAESETVRLAAIKELLARAFGRSPQDGSPIEQVIRWAKTAEEAAPDPSSNLPASNQHLAQDPPSAR